MKFEIDEEQLKKIQEWKNTLKVEYTGAIGGRFTYEFTPTGIGTAITVKDCVTDQSLDVSDYDNW